MGGPLCAHYFVAMLRHDSDSLGTGGLVDNNHIFGRYISNNFVSGDWVAAACNNVLGVFLINIFAK
jgi:hypothetical protein